MNILITEAQYNKLTEEKLREFLYGFWNNQKKHGEKPSLDDMLFRVLDINKNTNEDFQVIRPIWYDYNGGFRNLVEKVKNEIEDKTYELKSNWGNLDTRIEVIEVSIFGKLGEDFGVDIFVNVDDKGTMNFQMYEEGTDNEIEVNGTIEDAYFEAQSNYEGSDLLGYLRGEVYDFFYKKLEKYGIPIDVDVDITDIHGAPNSINESLFDELDGIKAITKYWKSKLKKGEEITFDKVELEYFNITEFSPKLHAQEVFYDLIGGHDYTDKFIKGLLNKTFSTEDFNESITGGYNFKWIINDFEYQDFRYKLYGEALPGGVVSMMDGRTLNLDEACNHVDFGWEIQNEVNDVVQECMEEIIIPKTGAHIKVPLIIVPEE